MKYRVGLAQFTVSRKGAHATGAVEPAFLRELKEDVKPARLESE